jgi:ribonuclease HI
MKEQEQMERDEALERLNAISEMIDNVFNNRQPMLVSTESLLERIQNVALGIDDQQAKAKTSPVLDHIIMSCDASITQNPGGTVAVGAIVEWPDGYPNPPMKIQQIMPKSDTNNQGEYDAIYTGLTSLMNLHNNPGCEIEVRSDSKLVVDQLNGRIKCNDEKLKRRKDIILELVTALPVPVRFVWRPRNSTPALEQANYLAQDALGVSRH